MSQTEPATDTVKEVLSDRVIGFLIDFVLLSVVVFIIWLLFFGLNFGVAALFPAESEGASLVYTIVSIVLSVLMWAVILGVVFGYFTYMDSGTGQTLGKRFADVTVVAEDGSTPTTRETAIRSAVLVAPAIIGALIQIGLSIILLGFVGFGIALGIIFVWLLIEVGLAYTSDRGQRLGDRMAGTMVVQA